MTAVPEQLETLAVERSRALNHAVARLKEREAELRRSRSETIVRLARALAFRDGDTGAHTERMSRYCALLAARAGVDEEQCELLELASNLHDIGKLAIPDEILAKPGPLTPEERELVQTHAELGHQLLAGSDEPLLELASRIAWTHHERFDGSGYPRRLSGSDIPIEGRIAAVADVFDALTSDRPYRPRLRLDQAIVTLREERRRFDPDLLDVFLQDLDEVVAIANGEGGPDR